MLNNNKSVAYFSMEYAIDQSLKIYSGGLGFLAGSHLRSAFALQKNLIGIGLLWKYGYYDQERDIDGLMQCNFRSKKYSFLKDTGIVFTVNVHDKDVFVKVCLLESTTFNTAPLYLLSTDLPENDYLSQTITNHLYDKNEATRIAQSIILGVGGGKLIDILGLHIDTYHLNEAHALPLAFYLLKKNQVLETVKQKIVFTTHTPEVAGNEVRSFNLLDEMHFFANISRGDIENITGQKGESFNYTLAALTLARKANAVSKIHGFVSKAMWESYPNCCEIISITNAQNQEYWQDKTLCTALKNNDLQLLRSRKTELKIELFKTVADQTGKIFDPSILTIVWARRFAGYKRADILIKDFEQFIALVSRDDKPIQVIWAGKPYPWAEDDIKLFKDIQTKTAHLKRVAVLTGYELTLSAQLKKGADIWLNTPRYAREASGTSGMSAAMNGAINFSIPDGWVPEFAKHLHNAFIINVAQNIESNFDLQNREERLNMYKVLNEDIIPTFYNSPEKWLTMMTNSMNEVVPQFDSNRMVEEYYKDLY